MVLARSCSLTAAAGLLAPLLGQSFNSMRERLRDTYLEAEAKAGEKHAWKPEWLALLKQFRGLLPAGWTVIVLADWILYAKWRFDPAIPVHPVTAKDEITAHIDNKIDNKHNAFVEERRRKHNLV